MKLLVFSHRGEARTFLKNYSLKSSSRLSNLYVGKELSLLISGEGGSHSKINLSFALALLEDVDEVINFGICGNLDFKSKKSDVNEILKIKTVYAEGEFKSFILGKDGVDLITAKKRILEKDCAESLSYIAPYVDRELWSYAFVCKEFNIPIKSFKLVSDDIVDANNCDLIREKSEKYSDHFFNYFDKLKADNIDRNFRGKNYQIFKHEKFYFALSQRRDYSKLMDSLCLKYGRKEEEILNDFLERSELKMARTNKNRTKKLIEFLDRYLYPVKGKIKESLERIIKESLVGEVSFKFDPFLEKKMIHFEAKIVGEKSLKNSIASLHKFNWNNFEKIMDGEIDV